MAERTYTATYKPKAPARRAGKVEMEFRVMAATVPMAKAEAAKALDAAGEVMTDYTGPKMVWLKNGSAAPQGNTEAEGTSGQGNNAADSESIEQATGDSWGALYGSPSDSDPAPTGLTHADEAEAIKVADEGAGSDLTVAEVEAEPLSIEQQVKLINAKVSALGIGERLRLENVPAKVYHQSIGYGSSAIKTVIEFCTGLLRAEMEGQVKRDEDKYVLGSATHDRLLLPGVFESDYVIQPKKVMVDGEELPLNVRNGKAWEQCQDDNAGKVIITQGQHDAAQAMRKAFLSAFDRYFSDGVAEVSYWYRDPDTGLVLKARPDYERGEAGFDVKTIGMWPSPENVDRQFRNLRYYCQEWHYLHVTGLARYPFFFVSTKAPHPTLGPRDSSDELAALGALECQQAYRTIKHCEDNDDWPWWDHQYEQVEPGYNERKKLEQYREGINA